MGEPHSHRGCQAPVGGCGHGGRGGHGATERVGTIDIFMFCLGVELFCQNVERTEIPFIPLRKLGKKIMLGDPCLYRLYFKMARGLRSGTVTVAPCPDWP